MSYSVATFSFYDITTTTMNPDQGSRLQGASGSGSTVSFAGDFNHDGLSDMLIAANGIAYVVFGQKGAPYSLDFSSSSSSLLNSGHGFSIAVTGQFIVYSVSTAGDFNNDQIDDILIGAYQPFPTGGEGSVYVIYGHKSPFSDLTPVINSLYNSQNGFQILGASADHIGTSVSRADINGDTIDDIIIGSYLSNLVYIVFGQTGMSADIDLGSVSLSSISRGFKITGVSGSNLGYAVSGLGDINGDKVDDMIIAANTASGNIGIVYVIFGRKSGLIDLNLNSDNLAALGRGFKITGEATGDQLGFSIGNPGDVNADGIDDMVIGAFGGGGNAGTAYVVFGRKSGFTDINLATTSLSTTQQGFKIFGAAGGDHLGQSVAGAGDVNNDGINDIVIGAINAQGGGAAYIIFGRNIAFSDIYLGSTDLATSKQGFTLRGASGNKIGSSVSGVGDINGDKIDDILIGALGISATYVIFGNDTNSPPNATEKSSNL